MRLKVAKNTFQGTIWGLISQLISLLFPFLIRAIIIRILGAEYAGISSLFSSILQVLSLAELGFGTAIVYAMYKPVAEDDRGKLSAFLNYFRKIYRLIGIIILATGLILSLFIDQLITGEYPDNIDIKILYFIYLLNTVSSYFFHAYYSSIIYAHQRQADTYRVQAIINLLSYSLQIIVLLVFKNYYLYIVLLPLTTIIYNYLVFKAAREKYPYIIPAGDIDQSERNEIRKNVTALFVYKIGSTVTNSVDSIVISAFLGLVMISNYNNYYYVIKTVTSLLYVFFNALTAGLGNRLVYNDDEQNKKDFSLIFAINALTVIVCTVCIYNTYQDFIALWVGEMYLFPYGTVALFCLYFFVHTIRKTVITYRDAAGMWRDNMFQPLVSASLNVFLDIVLIRRIGINGIVIGTIVSMALVDLPWETIVLLKKRIHKGCLSYFLSIVIYAIAAVAACYLSGMIIALIDISIIYLRMLVSIVLSLLLGVIMFSVFSFFQDIGIRQIYQFIVNKLSEVRR